MKIKISILSLILVALLVGCGSAPATLGVSRTGDVVTVTFEAGPQAAEQVALSISGNIVSLEDSKCKKISVSYGCDLGTIDAEKSYTLKVTGPKIIVVVSFYRPGSFGLPSQFIFREL
jgi:hypothetical protein